MFKPSLHFHSEVSQRKCFWSGGNYAAQNKIQNYSWSEIMRRLSDVWYQTFVSGGNVFCHTRVGSNQRLLSASPNSGQTFGNSLNNKAKLWKMSVAAQSIFFQHLSPMAGMLSRLSGPCLSETDVWACRRCVVWSRIQSLLSFACYTWGGGGAFSFRISWKSVT